jgi:type VI secretion system secreted protein VgrG
MGIDHIGIMPLTRSDSCSYTHVAHKKEDSQMQCLSKQHFSFQSQKLPPDSFGLVSFTGKEALSTCYTFDLLLISEQHDLDIPGILQSQATISFLRDGSGTVYYSGIPLYFEQLHAMEQYVFYRTRLVPRLYWLTFTHHNQVFLDKTVPEILEACLKDGGLTSLDFEFRLQKSYDPQDYVCQYAESHFHFISRWCEREGIYFFFEQTESGEKVIFTDSLLVHTALPQSQSLIYRAPSGLDHTHEQEILRTFNRRCHLVPATVFMKDYDYLKPSLDVSGSAEVDQHGRGQLYHYGDHFHTPQEGDRLAAIRAEALSCRQEIFSGVSTVPFLTPGYTFSLQDHYAESCNQSYLITEVTHEGNQTGYLTSGLQAGLPKADQQVAYKNAFTAIPSGVQFRLEQKTVKPRIAGTISARIDAAGSGKYAEIDEHGRYKVILPFDLSGRKDGKASARIRMSQPYSGSDHGMHFPLHKGTEVLLTFLAGDPDRPIIAAAIPNTETPSPVRDKNATQAMIKTAAQNKLAFDDESGKEQAHLQVPNKGSSLTVGTLGSSKRYFTRDDIENIKEGFEKYVEWMKETFGEYETMEKSEDVWGIELFTNKLLTISAEASNKVVLGEETNFIGGAKNEIVLGEEFNLVMGAYFHWVLGGIIEVHIPEKMVLENFHTKVNTEHLEASVKRLEATAMMKTEITKAKNDVIDEMNKVINRKLSAVNSELKVLNDCVEFVDKRVNATNDSVRAVNTTVAAHTESINACTNEIKSVGNTLEDVGMAVMTIGVSFEEMESCVAEVGEEIKNTGNAIQTGGMHARNFGLIADN